ncbi:MAG: histidine phosphatase family protein [Clostridia bacterium]|nr:histidine phosphatase family protein [Clostridia bacterium]
MTRLIITRHGQSIANAEKRFAGHSDFDLSDIGKHQAELAADYICEKEKIDFIYSSDLKRAYNTAVPTAKRLGMEIIPTTELREIFAGEWESLTTDEIAERYTADFDIWRNDYARSRCTGGESTAEVYERVVKAVCAIAEKHPGKTLLLSTHATVVRSLSAYSLGLTAEQAGDIPFTHNASINIFTYENGRLIPETLNIIEHLGDTVTGVHRSFCKNAKGN